MKKGKFIIISGPSGVGKGTICNVLLKELKAWFSVSMTTRGIREGEIDGVNYYFITKDDYIKYLNGYLRPKEKAVLLLISDNGY